jgi:polyisoprenoid-binding protein YceI
MPLRFLACGWTAIAIGVAGMAPPARAQAPAWHIESGDVVVRCPLTIGGSFEAKTQAIAGRLTPSAADASALEGTVSVELSTLDTGIGLRNTHLRERYLEVERGEGFARAVVSNIRLDRPAPTLTGRTGFRASLTVHGVTRPVLGTADITRQGGGVHVEAAFSVTLPEHDIPEPRYLGVGVKDVVQIRVTFSTSESRGTPQPSQQEP